MESTQRRHDQKADDSVGRLVRLVARKVYARSAALSRRPGSFPAAVSRRADLSGPLYRELVPALPDGTERPRNRARGTQRTSLAYSLSRGRLKRIGGRGHDASRNDVGRYRRGGKSRGRTLQASGRQETSPAADEPGNPGDCGFGGRP